MSWVHPTWPERAETLIQGSGEYCEGTSRLVCTGPFCSQSKTTAFVVLSQSNFAFLVSAPHHEGALQSEQLSKSLSFTLLLWEGLCFLSHWGDVFPSFLFCLLQLLLFHVIREWGIGVFEFIIICSLFPLFFFFRIHWLLIWQKDSSISPICSSIKLPGARRYLCPTKKGNPNHNHTEMWKLQLKYQSRWMVRIIWLFQLTPHNKPGLWLLSLVALLPLPLLQRYKTK